ncbi:MAG TPA: peptidoglycan-binding domain-containing protein [Oscillospiraceae bacterium]|nr:peptidoglycan-binding protein [Oscillospiraceae bacterium]HNW04318.1 peptidoglycan-binding domain-containing protein [Oscillospiraceae bacterium]HPV99510.1 peptidoglycan-binding domain-containing protein [Oscillospiraceae bacterium]
MNKYDANVAEIQSYLRALLQEENDSSPAIISDGIFGPETTKAVLNYQRNNGLAVSGTVDYETWASIIEKYGMRASCSGPAKTIVGFRTDELDLAPPGGRGSSVWFAQVMLLNIGRKFENFSGLMPNGVNSGPTTDALIYIQARAKTLYKDGTLDKSTWNAVVNLYNLTL